jgi:hypothetical protein
MEMLSPGLSVVMAVIVVVIGLYSFVFSRSAASWVLSRDSNPVRPDFHEKVYTAGFTVVGASFIMFGILTVLLIA